MIIYCRMWAGPEADLEAHIFTRSKFITLLRQYSFCMLCVLVVGLSHHYIRLHNITQQALL